MSMNEKERLIKKRNEIKQQIANTEDYFFIYGLAKQLEELENKINAFKN